MPPTAVFAIALVTVHIQYIYTSDIVLPGKIALGPEPALFIRPSPSLSCCTLLFCDLAECFIHFSLHSKSRIHEHSISLKFLGIFLRVLRPEVS
jgi:hypothetical protein